MPQCQLLGHVATEKRSCQILQMDDLFEATVEFIFNFFQQPLQSTWQQAGSTSRSRSIDWAPLF